MSDRVPGIVELRGMLARWFRETPEEIVKRLKPEGQEIVKEAITAHLSGPKMPRGVGSMDRATLQPQSGWLRRRMFANTPRAVQGTVQMGIGNNMRYGIVHEKGLEVPTPRGMVKMPERPFVAPSIEAREQYIAAAILDGAIRAFMRA